MGQRWFLAGMNQGEIRARRSQGALLGYHSVALGRTDPVKKLLGTSTRLCNSLHIIGVVILIPT